MTKKIGPVLRFQFDAFPAPIYQHYQRPTLATKKQHLPFTIFLYLFFFFLFYYYYFFTFLLFLSPKSERQTMRVRSEANSDAILFYQTRILKNSNGQAKKFEIFELCLPAFAFGCLKKKSYNKKRKKRIGRGFFDFGLQRCSIQNHRFRFRAFFFFSLFSAFERFLKRKPKEGRGQRT